MAFIALIERDDKSHVPTLGGQTEEAQGIVSGVQGGSLDG
jgi:hypothetical protein